MAEPTGTVSTQVSPQNRKKSKVKRKDHSTDGNKLEHESTPKKLKWTDYSVIEFKVEIKDPNSTFQALTKFQEQAKAFPNLTAQDLVTEYCRSSSECEEICKLLEGKRKITETYLIFGTLECILLRLSEDESKLKIVGRNIIQTVLKRHTGLLYVSLSMKNKSSHIKAALKLLIAMVMQGEEAAKEVLANLDFTHPCFQPLLYRRDVKDEQDVRTCLIQLLMSILLIGDITTVKELVDTRGFLNSIFPGLSGDKISTLELTLPVLLDRVVNNSAISRTSKIRLFNDKTLRDISRLYNWTGARRGGKVIRKNKGQKEDVEVTTASVEDQETVKKICHEFLVAVCCDIKHGINFFDSSYGTSEKNQNHILTNLLKSLDCLNENELASDLAVQVLKACPDQLHWYLPSLKSSMDPRPSQKWLTCIGFVEKIYRSQPDIIPIFSLKHTMSTEKLVSMALNLLIPPQEIWACVCRALSNKSQIVRHRGLRLLHRVLLRCRYALEYCLQQEANSTHHLTAFVPALREVLSKTLPDFGAINQCWNRELVNSPQTDENEEALEKNDQEVDKSLVTVNKDDYLLEVIQNICLYQRILPDEMSEQSIDSAGLLEGIRSVCVDQSETSILLQIFVMKCIAATDVKHFSWMKEGTSGRSTLYLLLEMVTTIKDDEHLRDVAVNILKQLFSATGVFSGTEEEITVWLHELCLTPESERESVLSYLHDIVITVLVKDPYSYTEQIADLQHNAVDLKDIPEAETGSIASTSEAIMDRILSLDDVDLTEELKEDTDRASDGNKQNDVLPFSPLLLVAIEILSSQERMKGQPVKQYLQRVVLSIWRTQRDGLPISLIVYNNSTILFSKELHRIALQWLPENMHEALSDTHAVAVEDFNKPDIPAWKKIQLLSQSSSKMWKNSDVIENLSEKLKLTDAEDCIPLAKQILQYIKLHIVQNQLRICDTLLGFLTELLKVLVDDLSEDSLTKEIEHKEIEELLLNLTPKQRIGEFLSLILNHDVIKEFFLKSKGNDSNGKSTKLIDLVTLKVTEIIFLTPDECLKTESLTYFKEKLYTTIGEMHQVASTAILSCLEAFFGYLNACEISKCLRFLLKLSPNDLVQDEKLSNQGQFVVRFFRVLLNDSHDVFIANCPLDILRALVLLIHKTGNSELEKMFMEILQKSTLCSLAATYELLESCLRRQTDQSLQVARMLVQHSPVCRHWLEQWCKDSQNFKLKKKYVEKLWSVMVASASVKNGPEEFTTVMRDLTGDTNRSDQFYRGLWKLCQSGYEATSAEGPVEKKILELRCQHASTDDKDKASFVQDCIQVLSETIGTKNNPRTSQFVIQLVDILTESFKIHEGNYSIDNNLCKQMIKILLKKYFTEPKVMVLLRFMCNKVKGLSRSVPDLYQMVVSHSQFLPSILDTSYTLLKEALVDLLIAFVKMAPECCKDSHIPTLFGSYQATLHRIDRKIIKLLEMYENNDCKLTAFRPYLWGPKAVEHQASRQSLGPSLTKQPSTEQVLDALSSAQLYQSSLHFPLNLKMHCDDVVDLKSTESLDGLYDPSFMLPLFSHLTASESLLNCRRFIEMNCLGYVICALSSRDAVMRGVAYSVLTSFYQYMQGSKFSERYQIICMMDSLKNSVESPNQRLPCVVTIFYLKVAQVLLKPDDTMYSPINEFLLLKPSIDTGNVPEFFKLFNSSSDKHKIEREWMLNLLKDGLREAADYHIFEKRNISRLLLSFCDSGLGEQSSQEQVIEILIKACELKAVATNLVKNHAFLCWIERIIQNRSKFVKLQDKVMELLCVLWDTMSGADLGAAESEKEAVKVPFSFVKQIQLLCISFLHNSRYYMGVKQLSRFTKCLSTILDQLESASSGNINIIYVWQLLNNWVEFCNDAKLKDFILGIQGLVCDRKVELTTKGKVTDRTQYSDTEQFRNCARELVNIFCHVRLNFSENTEVKGNELTVKVANVVLTVLHLHCTKTDQIVQKSAEWLRDLLIVHCPNSMNVLLANDGAEGRSLVSKILALYETVPLQPDNTPLREVEIKLTQQHVNEILLSMLDKCEEDKIPDSLLSNVLKNSSFKKIVSKLKGNKAAKFDVVEYSNIMAELFLRVDKPIHSKVLCGYN